MEKRRLFYVFGAILGILIFILAVIFGTKKPVNQKKPNEVVEEKPIILFGTLENEKLQPLISAFSPYGKLNYFYFDEKEIYSKFLESIAKNEYPDALLISDKIFNSFQDKITPFFPSANLDIFDFLKETYTKEGYLLAYPIFVDPIFFVANKKFFLSLGILKLPQTFDELNELIQYIKSQIKERIKEIGVINLGTISNNDFIIEILTFFALNFGAESKDIFSNYPDAWSKSLNYYFSFSDDQSPNYSFNETFPPVIESLAQEKLITAFVTYSSLDKIKKINPDIEFLISSLPVKDILKRKSLFNTYLLILPKVSKNQEGVKRFLSFIYNFPEKVVETGFLPSRRGNYNLNEINDLFFREILVGKTILWPPKDLIEDAIFKAKVELSYNKNVGNLFIENFK